MILIVEDDEQNLRVYQRTVQRVQTEVEDASPIHSATTFEEALGFFSEERRLEGKIPLLVIVDMEIPRRGHKDPKAGYLLMEQLHSQFPETAWLPITAHIALQDQRLANGHTLLDALYTLSNWGIHYKDRISNMESMLRRFFASRQQEPLKNGDALAPGVYGVTLNGEQFVTVNYGFYSEIRSVAEDDRPVVVFGKRGTGKRLTARLVHYFSPRQGDFVAVDGMAEEADLSQRLFPSVSGAEGTARSCVLDESRDGTLYIRNFDRAPKSIQRRILHLLQYRDYNVRLVGGICQSRREFRNYERILPEFMDTMIPLDLPALAERKDDIPALVRSFLEQFNQRRTTAKQPGEQRPPKNIVDLGRTCRLLSKKDWSYSNVAGLRLVIEEVLLKTPAQVITVEDFEKMLQSSALAGQGEDRVADHEQKPRRKRRRVVVTEEDIRRYG